MLMKKVITQFLCGLVVLWLFPSRAFTQDWIKTGTGLGVEKIRIAVPEFKGTSQDPRNTELLKTFNDTLWNDLDSAGIFDMVSKSFYPLKVPGQPTEVTLGDWNSSPRSFVAWSLVFSMFYVNYGCAFSFLYWLALRCRG